MNDYISKPLPSDLLREWTRLREPGSPLSAAQPLQCALALSNVEIDDYLQNDFIVNEMDNAVIELSQMMAADDVHRNVTSCDDNTRASTFGFSDDDLNSLTHCMSSEMLFDSLLIRRGDLECDDDSANFGSLGFVVGLVNCTSATGDASCVPHSISSNIKVTATVAVQTETHLQQQPHVQSQAPVQAQLPTMVGNKRSYQSSFKPPDTVVPTREPASTQTMLSQVQRIHNNNGNAQGNIGSSKMPREASCDNVLADKKPNPFKSAKDQYIQEAGTFVSICLMCRFIAFKCM
jgi:hypothetical protein